MLTIILLKEFLIKALKRLYLYGKMTKHKGVVGTYCVMRSTHWNYPGLILNGETYLHAGTGGSFFCADALLLPAFSAK